MKVINKIHLGAVINNILEEIAVVNKNLSRQNYGLKNQKILQKRRGEEK